MKFAFVTCVQLGLSCMEEIYCSGGALDLVMTLEDNCAPKKSGRIYVDEFCKDRNIDIVKIRNINSNRAIDAIKCHAIDWLFIIGWSQVARQELLDAPAMGCLGMHPTLLPEGRGRAAIPWAILKNLHKTGVTLFKLDDGVDTGPIIAQEVIHISNGETASTLYEKVTLAHRSLITKTWPSLIENQLHYTEQDETKATFWPERTPDDGIITTEMTVDYVDKLVRAVTRPYPGAFFDYRNNKYIIWSGEAHKSKKIDHTVVETDSGRLWLSLLDGCFESTDWERL